MVLEAGKYFDPTFTLFSDASYDLFPIEKLYLDIAKVGVISSSFLVLENVTLKIVKYTGECFNDEIITMSTRAEEINQRVRNRNEVNVNLPTTSRVYSKDTTADTEATIKCCTCKERHEG